jgi:putative NIF3 family GTP cyclohydrolase 1 type 2
MKSVQGQLMLNVSVILTEHSNSERGFLSAILLPKLQKLLGSDVEIIVSSSDRDPLQLFQ